LVSSLVVLVVLRRQVTGGAILGNLLIPERQLPSPEKESVKIDPAVPTKAAFKGIKERHS